MRAVIFVTHLLGTGHLRRADTLARAFRAAGHSATVVSGGMPVAGMENAGMVQLPPLRSDGTDFAHLLDENGATAGLDYLEARRTAALSALESARPDVLITELFPFGRRVLADEFTALLEQARGRADPPVILASVRDILAPPSKPAKARRTADLIAGFYDGVLVHSDATATPLEASWPVTPDLRARLHYTGYVTAPPAGPHPDAAGAGEVLVSAGGGDVGDHLFATAAAAAARTPGLRWRLLVGGRDAQARVARLSGGAAIVETARPDFRQMLWHAACSVSMCGYNTALDVLQAGTPSVLVPFDAGGETEQGLRAESLARLPSVTVLRDADLHPAALAEAVGRMARAPRRDTAGLRYDGAARSVEICADLLDRRG
ncbi:MAG: glycosyltransferase [Rhodobacteraceae bacterium]|nr:glycosyltransferase [Paracoccaceae bacterium]